MSNGPVMRLTFDQCAIFFNLSKAFVPKHIASRVNLGCEFQAFGGRLNELFLTKPTIDENNQHLIDKAINHLQQRISNEQLFRL